MNFVIAEYLDYDLGHKYAWWKNSTLELFGSWDHWTTGIPCNFGVLNANFFAYVPMTLDAGTYEYKFKFTGECSFGIQSEWFGDKSIRTHVSEYVNQLLTVNDELCSEQNQLQTINSIPKYFDHFAVRNHSLNDLFKHINSDCETTNDLPNVIFHDTWEYDEILDDVVQGCIIGTQFFPYIPTKHMIDKFLNKGILNEEILNEGILNEEILNEEISCAIKDAINDVIENELQENLVQTD